MKDYIFIHIPRTGGRSIQKAFGIEYESACEFIHKNIKTHIVELTEPVVRSKFKFTVVRNPWDQSVAYWRNFHGKVPRYGHTFESWIQWIAKEYPNRKNDDVDWDFKMPLDQLEYCRNKNGEVLIDYFLKFETLEQDFIPIADKFKLPQKLPTVGTEEKSKSVTLSHATEDYRDMYKSQESIDAVISLNKELIERFNYRM
jgi:hypothetical protein